MCCPFLLFTWWSLHQRCRPKHLLQHALWWTLWWLESVGKWWLGRPQKQLGRFGRFCWKQCWWPVMFRFHVSWGVSTTSCKGWLHSCIYCIYFGVAIDNQQFVSVSVRGLTILRITYERRWKELPIFSHQLLSEIMPTGTFVCPTATRPRLPIHDLTQLAQARTYHTPYHHVEVFNKGMVWGFRCRTQLPTSFYWWKIHKHSFWEVYICT